MTKCRAERTWTDFCERWFDSKAKAERGEELRVLKMTGDIKNLRY